MKIFCLILITIITALVIFLVRVIDVCNEYRKRYINIRINSQKKSLAFNRFYREISNYVSQQHEAHPKRKGYEDIMQTIDLTYDKVMKNYYLDPDKHC